MALYKGISYEVKLPKARKDYVDDLDPNSKIERGETYIQIMVYSGNIRVGKYGLPYDEQVIYRLNRIWLATVKNIEELLDFLGVTKTDSEKVKRLEQELSAARDINRALEIKNHALKEALKAARLDAEIKGNEMEILRQDVVDLKLRLNKIYGKLNTVFQEA